MRRCKLRRCGSLKLVSLTLIALLVASCARLKQFAFNRDSWQQPDKVIAALDLHPGEIVADLGSGGGYFTFKLARAVAPSGKIYAVDIDKDMIELIDKRLKEQQSGNDVETILATATDPLLPQTGVDLIFTVNSYHHIADRVPTLRMRANICVPAAELPSSISTGARGWKVFSATIRRARRSSGRWSKPATRCNRSWISWTGNRF